MSSPSQPNEINLKVSYNIDPDSKTVTFHHPALSGVLGFEFTSTELAEVQLKALDTSVELNPIESILSDTVELVKLGAELKELLGSFRKKQ